MRLRLRKLTFAALALTWVCSPNEAQAGRKQLEASAQRQLDLTRTAADLRKGLAALKREQKSLAYAEDLLRHRGEESLRRLSAYRAARGAREGQASRRARTLYKLARGGLARLYFEDLAPGSRDEKSADRITRGRTIRWLVRHDLRELGVHRRAEARAREELLAATREYTAVSALRMVQGLQSAATEGLEDQLTPVLVSAARTTRRLAESTRLYGRVGHLVDQAVEEYGQLRRKRGFDLLESSSLPRPVAGKIVGRFGKHRDRELRVELDRKGLEFRGQAGEKVKAVAVGKVAFVGALPGYDQVVVIDHGGGYLSLTGRLLDLQVQEGDELKAGDALGRVAPAPPKTPMGTRVYFEIRHGERPIDPTRFFKSKKASK